MNISLNIEALNEASQPAKAGLASGEMPLPTPSEFRASLPVPAHVQAQIHQHREDIRRVLHGDDPRTLVVIGPCSIHDEVAALEYAEKLKNLADDVSERFLIIMRAYLEKPRTIVGWKGLLYDPERTGTGDLNEGLLRSRRLLLNLSDMGLPLATEALSPFAMDYLGDLVSWTAIGARTAESQVHRELVSGLPMPTGFKNGTDGSIGVAINAMKSAAHSHHRFGVGSNGAPAMITTDGNPDTHLVLRGGRGITNYDAESIREATALAFSGQEAQCHISHAARTPLNNARSGSLRASCAYWPKTTTKVTGCATLFQGLADQISSSVIFWVSGM